MVKSKKKTVFIAVLSVIALAIISTVGFVHAKYVYKKYYDKNTVRAEDFYFTIDLLGDYETAKEIDVFSGNVTLPFTVQNFFDGARVNAKDVKYTVTYNNGGVSGVLLKKGDNTITTDSATLSGGAGDSEKYELYIPHEYTDEAEITVTVKSTAPYAKEMTLTFKLNTYAHDVEYYVKDGAGLPYAELIILANTDIAEQKIVVDWTEINASDNVFEVDCTNPNVLDYDKQDDKTLMTLTVNNPENDTKKYLSTIKITRPMDTLESISIYFFKDDATQNYSVARTHAVESDGTYTIKLIKPTAAP